MLFRPACAFRTALLLLALDLSHDWRLAAQEARWEELDHRAEELHKQGNYAEALPVAKEALSVAEATFGPDNANTATALNRLGVLNQATGKYAEAQSCYERALATLEKSLGLEHPDVATTLGNMAELSVEQGRYSDAEPLFKRSLSILEKSLGPQNPQVAKELNSLGELYDDQGRYSEAEPLYQRALDILQKVQGPESLDVATSLHSLGALYYDEGKYSEAEVLYKRSLAIQERRLPPEHPNIAEVLNDLAVLFKDEMRYAEAEALYKRSLTIDEKVLGPEHPDVAQLLNNLAVLYRAQGKYADSEELYKRTLAIREKVDGPDHPDVALALNNLATLFRYEGRDSEAEAPYKRSLAIRERALGPEHPDVAATLDNLAKLYISQRRYAEAEPLSNRALDIYEKVLGPDHPYVAFSLSSLASLYWAEGRKIEAERFYLRALKVREQSLGPGFPELEASLSDLARFYYAEGFPHEASSFFERSLDNVSRRLESNFAYMSERDRLSFLETLSSAFPLYFSYCFTNRDADPRMVGKMYDVLLWQKGVIAQSIGNMRARIAATGDNESLGLLEDISVRRTRLSNLYAAHPRDIKQWRSSVEQLEKETNDKERELVRRSATLAEEKKLVHATWHDVQKALGRDEVAIELVGFPFHDGRKFTGKTYYVALVASPQTISSPTMVALGDAATLERDTVPRYRKWVSRSGPAPGLSLYDALWKPLESILRGSKKVYLSPDGILNQISWGVIPTPGGRLLMDEFDLRVVSSTRDLLRERTALQSHSAVLIGNPRFDLSEAEQRAAAGKLRTTEQSKAVVAWAGNGLRSRDLNGVRLSPLPGTSAELERVRSVLSKHGWNIDVYTGQNALVDTVKRVQSPRVLHLATHGFFLSDQERQKNSSLGDLPSGAEDPMLRSGLYFAGADRTLAGGPPAADLDDGILTAFEASGLNLQGTELVVLSACYTGLGEVKNGEGVFGLRRALEEAGAESVMMSLWSVPDRETQELMSSFYKHWLSGQDKPAALRSAQMELRKIVKARYGQDRPFYWGGFVLLGR